MALRPILRIGMTCARTVWAAVLVLSGAACSVPDTIERQGNFRIEDHGMDALGETSTRRAVDHIDGATTTRVTDAAVSFDIAPRDQNRILYVTCDVDPDCTLNSGDFDGHTKTNHVIGDGLKVLVQPSMTPTGGRGMATTSPSAINTSSSS